MWFMSFMRHNSERRSRFLLYRINRVTGSHRSKGECIICSIDNSSASTIRRSPQIPHSVELLRSPLNKIHSSNRKKNKIKFEIWKINGWNEEVHSIKLYCVWSFFPFFFSVQLISAIFQNTVVGEFICEERRNLSRWLVRVEWRLSRLVMRGK